MWGEESQILGEVMEILKIDWIVDKVTLYDKP
jgi:hypothetical protein